MQEIFVTNRNDGLYHSDKFNGVEYEFPPNEKVLVPVEAARHMLGFGIVDKTDTLTRLGWANDPNEAGVKRLAAFVFTQAVTVEVPVEDVGVPTQAAVEDSAIVDSAPSSSEAAA